MPKRIKIPQYAKENAMVGLARRAKSDKSDKFATKEGVERAQQIINNKYLYEDDAKEVGRFWIRFRNKKSKRMDNSFLLWGGRKFSKNMAEIYYNK